MENVKMVLKVVCAVMALVNMVFMCKANKEKDTNAMVSNGFWAVIMVLLWKL